MAQDDRLLELMALSKFSTVFIGIETPDTDSLKLTMKHQNNRKPMNESLEKIAKSGLRIMAGFIIGFDDEKKGAGERVFQFATENAIPGVTFSMLQALPGTALWDRLKASGRLLDDANLNQTTLLNFVPTRPIEEIAEEYVNAFWKLYDPKVYLKRVFDHFMLVGQAKVHQDPELRKKLANQHKTDFDLKGVLFGLKMLAKLGVVRSTRFVFWKYLYLMFKKNPGGIGNFLSFAAFMEHFLPYRKMVKKEIQEALQARIDGKVKVLDTNIELSDELTEGVEWYKAS
jgi:radical SAM superfamily enzyme YgiQ (UPF0313 family)